MTSKRSLEMETSVEALLSTVPMPALVGLRSVLLIADRDLSKSDSARHYPRSGKSLLGRYYDPRTHDGAWIEIYLDAVLRGLGPLSHVALVREYHLGRVLFHELGHHVHRKSSSRGDKEAFAEAWSREQRLRWFRARHWSKRHVIRLLLPIVRWLRRARTTHPPPSP